MTISGGTFHFAKTSDSDAKILQILVLGVHFQGLSKLENDTENGMTQQTKYVLTVVFTTILDFPVYMYNAFLMI